MQRRSYRQIKKRSKSISGPKTSRSASALNNIEQSNNSANSNQSKVSDISKKWECESHQFELKPLFGERNYYGYTRYSMVHEGNYKPYPVVLT